MNQHITLELQEAQELCGNLRERETILEQLSEDMNDAAEKWKEVIALALGGLSPPHLGHIPLAHLMHNAANKALTS